MLQVRAAEQISSRLVLGQQGGAGGRAARAAAVTAVPGQLLPGCLSELDRAVLSFACAHHLQGRVDARVQQELGVTATGYYPAADRSAGPLGGR